MPQKKTKMRGKSRYKKVNSAKNKKSELKKKEKKTANKNTKKNTRFLDNCLVKRARTNVRKKPDYATLLKKRQKLALAIRENLRQKTLPELKRLGVFGSLPELIQRVGKIRQRPLLAEKKTELEEEISFVLESVIRPEIKHGSGQAIKVKVVRQPLVSPHLIDIKSMIAEKQRLLEEAVIKKENSFVARLTDKKKLYNTLNEVSLINLAQVIYLAGKNLAKHLVHVSDIFNQIFKHCWQNLNLAKKLFRLVKFPLVRLSIIQKIQSNKKIARKKNKAGFWLFNWRKPAFIVILPSGWHKSLIAFLLVALLLALPIQAFTYYSELQNKQSEIVSFSAEALVHLRSAVKAAGEYSFDAAEEEFSQASKNFSQAYEEFKKINSLTFQILSHLPLAGKKIKGGEKLIQVGYNFSLLGELFSQSAQGLAFNRLTDVSLTDQLNIIITNTQKIQEVITELDNNLENIDLSMLPGDGARDLGLIKGQLPAIKLAIERLNNVSTMLYQMMALDGVKRYLLIFQNNREMRASGGFMGSYALLDVYKGKIQNFEVPAGGTYDISGQVLEKIVPPEPLLYINSNWQFHDSNWWPDWPASARKIIWFFEKGAKTSVDGVLTITPTVIEKLLPVFGPIDLSEKHDVVVNETNLVDIIQEEIEDQRKEASRQPKQILTDLSGVLLDKLLKADQEQFLAALEVLNQAVREKQIMFYFPDSRLEVLALKNNIAGEIKPSDDNDYLNIINTNIGGGKTDQVIKEKIWQEVEILADGSVVDTVTIQKKHEGGEDSFFENHGNINYLRVYAPLGSQLLEAGGFNPPVDDKFLVPAADAVIDSDLRRLEGEYIIEPYTKTKIYEQFGKTVFANWTHTEPGQTTEVKIKYKLPFKVYDTKDKGWASWFKEKINWPEGLKTYRLIWQKQAGSLVKDYSLNIKYPSDLPVVWQHLPDVCSHHDQMFSCNSQFKTDQLFMLSFKKH